MTPVTPVTWPPNIERLRGLPQGSLLRCRCGREVGADMMLDVNALPPAVRGDASELCDACVEMVLRKGLISREEMYRLLSAPPALIAKAARLDLLQQLPQFPQ